MDFCLSTYSENTGIFCFTKCNFWTNDDNIGPKLKKPSFVILGV